MSIELEVGRTTTGIADPGRILLGAAMAGLGVLSLLSGDFALVWQPVPPWVPWRHLLACASGAVMLASGAGLLWRRTVGGSALAVTIYWTMCLLLLDVPRVVSTPLKEATWLGCGERATLVCGAWALSAACSGPRWAGRVFRGERAVRSARTLYAAALLPIGLSHFVYSAVTAELVPSWLPGRLGWAYVTGAGHIAAGVAILFALVPRLAATLEAAMVSTFVLLIHLPDVVRLPADRMPWTAFFMASAIGGAAWTIAHSYRDTTWLAAPPAFARRGGRA